MHSEYGTILQNMLIALAAGGLIGFERSYHGRPAGFRTHTLVCMASSLLMLVTIFQAQWFPHTFVGSLTMDPTRMAQGIMTGIGFLGAGVIIKEGLSVRGLTTAASIWITAAIGILAGIGFYFPAVLATVLTLGALVVFRWIETRMPFFYYAQHVVRFPRDAPMPEPEFRKLVAEHGFSIANLSYRASHDGRYFEYQMVIRTRNPDDLRRLAETLARTPGVLEFRISPTGD